MTNNIHDRFQDEVRTYLPADQVDQFLEACRMPLKKSITINNSKISSKDFISITKKWWWTLTPTTIIKDNNTFYIDRDNTDTALGRTFLHEAGYMYIQEVAAASSAPLLEVKDGDTVLDMASSPWWKASQLANMLLSLQTPWLVVANDVNPKRLRQLTHNLNRIWVYNTAVTRYNGFSFGKNMPNFFDHILLDAPCSGEWTAYKSDFALKHRKIEEINKIAGTQFQLLVSAIKATKAGGSIIYSTCTINPYENEYIISKAKEFFKDDIEIEALQTLNTEQWLKLDDTTFDTSKCVRLRPHIQKTWWFFICKIRKVNPTQATYTQPHKLSPKNQFTLTKSKKLHSEANARIKKSFGFELDPEKHLLVATKEKVYLTSPTFNNIQEHLHCEKVGIPILKIDRLFGFRPTHYLGNILWHLATKNVFELNDEQAQIYSESKNLPLEGLAPPGDESVKDYLLTRRGTWFSRTKLVKWEWKNKFSK